MHDRVADVLAQRGRLDRGIGAGAVVAVVLHAGLAGAVIYSAMHASPPAPAKMVSIQFANMPAVQQAPKAPRRA
ncbi:MAG TPA: hypothetical protein VEO54_00110, partial [Thermoanaerobaculia bacterium]|nr:hypothetical protein [Thermoanaerobaculia bacterium]